MMPCITGVPKSQRNWFFLASQTWNLQLRLEGIVGLTLEVLGPVLGQLDKAAVTNQQAKMPQAAHWEIKTLWTTKIISFH